MSEPKWLIPNHILAIHEAQLFEHGGKAGLRDGTALGSALGRPQNQFQYGQTDIVHLSTAYAFAIAKNHPFIDGNKRTAFVAMFVFLLRNGYHLKMPEPQAVELILALASGSLTQEELAERIRPCCHLR